jgi:hypothetical protein
MAKTATGKVVVLHVHDVTTIGLGDTNDVLPKNGFFLLRPDNPNFNALYSMALSAAINRYDLRIVTTTEITPEERAEVERLALHW